MKKILTLFILLLAIPHAAFALTTTDTTVWYVLADTTKQTAAIGDDILIYAKLTNTTNGAITYTVVFNAPDANIGTKVSAVPAHTEQSVSVPWKMPAVSTVVTATITKATDTHAKEIKTLVGTIGSTTIVASRSFTLPKIGALSGVVGSVVTYLDTWRLTQLDYFTTLKEKSSSVLEQTTIKDVGDLLKPQPIENPDNNPGVQKSDKGSIMGYAGYMYATAGKAFFAHTALYFITIILLALLTLRLIFNRLFR